MVSTRFLLHICMNWGENVLMGSVPTMKQQKHKGETEVTQLAMISAQMWHSSPENQH